MATDPNPTRQADNGGERLSAGEERFELWRRRAGVVLAPVAFALAWWLGGGGGGVGGGGLSPEGRTLAAILAAVGVLWVTETVPLPVTALLGACLCVILGVGDAKRVFAYFADPIVFVFIGGFMLARAMSVHGLDRRIALGFLSLRWVGGTPAGMLGGLGLVTAVLSMWVSNTATTAMMLPIGLGMLGALHRMRVARGGLPADTPMDARRWPFATAMMLMIAYAASIGGIGTPVGSPPNLIGIGLVRRNVGVEISFFQWMLLCVPMMLIMGLGLFFLLRWLHRDPGTAAPAAPAAGPMRAADSADMLAYIRAERAKLGRWTAGQANALVAFVVAVTLWVTPGVLALPWFAGSAAEAFFKARLPEAVAAIVAAVLLFLLPVNLSRGEFTLTWREAAKIDWGTILLFGGGLAMGSLMFDTGVAKVLGESLTARLGVSSLWALTALSIAMAIVLSEAASNTASANMIVPVAIAIALQAGVDPLPPALGAVLGASFGFMLPVSTPPNAIVYGSGLVPIGRMLRAGVFFDVLGFLLILGGLYVLYPLVFGAPPAVEGLSPPPATLPR